MKTRIQITSDWRDACINKELEEVEKLERFIQEEKARSHAVAQNLIIKQQETEQKRQSIMEFKKQKQIEIKQKNLENAAKAG